MRIALEPLWSGGHHVGGVSAGELHFSPTWEVLVMSHGEGVVWVGSPSRPVGGLVASGQTFRIISGE